MDSFKVDLSVGVSRLVLEGSETFVTATLEKWGSKILSNEPPPSAALKAPDTAAPEETSGPKQNALAQFENVFDSADGKLKIIGHVPGSNKAVLTRNTALIYLYGRLLEGTETVPSEELRQACVDQGCYDSTNFAQYLKGLKSAVVMNTKHGGGYDVKLTAPGRKAARELVESLNGEAA